MKDIGKTGDHNQFRRWKCRVTMGAQGIVVDADRRILLVRHGYRRGWHFPGGGVEHRETIEAALKRELFEEGGIELSGPPRMFGIYSHFDEFPGDHIVLYVVEAWRQPTIPAPSFEIAEQRFFDLNAMPDDLTAGSQRRIAELFYGQPRTQAW